MSQCVQRNLVLAVPQYTRIIDVPETYLHIAFIHDTAYLRHGPHSKVIYQNFIFVCEFVHHSFT